MRAENWAISQEDQQLCCQQSIDSNALNLPMGCVLILVAMTWNDWDEKGQTVSVIALQKFGNWAYEVSSATEAMAMLRPLPEGSVRVEKGNSFLTVAGAMPQLVPKCHVAMFHLRLLLQQLEHPSPDLLAQQFSATSKRKESPDVYLKWRLQREMLFWLNLKKRSLRKHACRKKQNKIHLTSSSRYFLLNLLALEKAKSLLLKQTPVRTSVKKLFAFFRDWQKLFLLEQRVLFVYGSCKKKKKKKKKKEKNKDINQNQN